MKKHICPHCGERTFTPLMKARCGGMSSVGKHCPKCGGRCVNGKVSLAVHSVLLLAALVMIVYMRLTFVEPSEWLWKGLLPLAAALALGFLFDMFFGKLIEAIRLE